MDHELIDRAVRHAHTKGWAVLPDLSTSDVSYWNVRKRERKPNYTIIPSAGADVTSLTPKSKGSAKAFSLSGAFGLGEFPGHTDGAHLTNPPDLVWLWCENGDVKTRIMPLPGSGPELDSARDALERGVFRVGSGQNSFLAVALSDSSKLRFDEACMKPLDYLSKRATHFLHSLQNVAVEHQWKLNEALIINNRKVLHGRDAIGDGQEGRTMLRIWMRLE